MGRYFIKKAVTTVVGYWAFGIVMSLSTINVYAVATKLQFGISQTQCKFFFHLSLGVLGRVSIDFTEGAQKLHMCRVVLAEADKFLFPR